MLKALTARCSSHAAFRPHLHGYVPAGEPASPLLRVLRGQNRRSPYVFRRFFCSDSTDGSDPVDAAGSEAKRVEAGEEAADSKSASTIVPTVVRPEDCLTVLALPLLHRPLFPRFCMPIYDMDPKLLAALVESRKRQAPYTGAFLLKDEEGTEGSDTEKNIYDLKGKELFDRLHEVGTLAQISSIQGDQVVLIGHKRLRITEMVSEDPLTVKVDHLKEKPYDKDDDRLMATSFEVISILRDILKTRPLWRDHAQTYTQYVGDFTYPIVADFGAAISGRNKLLCQQVLEELDHVGDFTYPRVADLGAAISGRNKLQCQKVLEELDVGKRLVRALVLVQNSKIEESIAKDIDQKISGERDRYLFREIWKNSIFGPTT